MAGGDYGVRLGNWMGTAPATENFLADGGSSGRWEFNRFASAGLSDTVKGNQWVWVEMAGNF